MRNKSEYIARMQIMIEQLHNCLAIWHSTALVHEVFQGEIVWEGDVEIFDLTGHPTAKRCYGWSDGDPEAFITVLQSPEVRIPQDAVKVMLGNQLRKRRK